MSSPAPWPDIVDVLEANRPTTSMLIAAAAGEELDFVADFHAEAFGEELAEERVLGVVRGLPATILYS